MNEEADPKECWLCPTHSAVLRFAEAAYASLARKAVFRLRRIRASGIYGDDFRHKTLWDEYCHEVQEGPHELLEPAWDMTLDPILDAVVQDVPLHEAALLTIGAVWDLNEDDAEPQGGISVCPDLICRNLKRVVAEMASARDMTCFDPLRDL